MSYCPTYNDYNVITVDLNNLKISDDYSYGEQKYRICDISNNFHIINNRDYDTLRKAWIDYDRNKHSSYHSISNRNIVKIYLSNDNYNPTGINLPLDYTPTVKAKEKPKLNLKILLV
jgi:hypothetical protein